MKRFFNLYKYTAVLAVLLALFSCSDLEDRLDNSSETTTGKARLYLSLGDASSRTILPADIAESDITKAELLAKADGASEQKSVKEWSSDDSTTAIAKMTGDKEVFVDIGTYDFTLNLYVSSSLCQTATLEGKSVLSGSTNALEFSTKYTGQGSFSLVLKGLSEQKVTAVKAGLFTVESNGETALNGYALEDLTVSENSVTYAKTDVAGGTYFVRFELYQEEAKIDTLEDIITIASGRISSKSITLADINTIYTITYNLNGGEWNEGFTPETSRNANKTVVLPTAENVFKQYGEYSWNSYKFYGWYTDEGCTEANKVTEISAGTAENKTLYAKWGPFDITIVNKTENGGTVTASASTAFPDEEVTLSPSVKEGYEYAGYDLNYSNGYVSERDNNDSTFRMDPSDVTITPIIYNTYIEVIQRTYLNKGEEDEELVEYEGMLYFEKIDGSYTYIGKRKHFVDNGATVTVSGNTLTLHVIPKSWNPEYSYDIIVDTQAKTYSINGNPAYSDGSIGLKCWKEEGTDISSEWDPAVILEKTSTSITEGSEETLYAAALPGNDRSYTWASSNPNVATVDQSGKVTAVALGNATITATTDTGKKAECSVVVNRIVTWDSTVIGEIDIEYYDSDKQSYTNKGITVALGDNNDESAHFRDYEIWSYFGRNFIFSATGFNISKIVITATDSPSGDGLGDGWSRSDSWNEEQGEPQYVLTWSGTAASSVTLSASDLDVANISKIEFTLEAKE